MSGLSRILRELRRYPSAIVGLIMVMVLVALSIYSMVTIPYREAIRLWRGGEDVWGENPKMAWPKWLNWFRAADLPPTIVIDTTKDPALKTFKETSQGKDYTVDFTFDFPYYDFPQELSVFFTASYQAKQPYVSLTWFTPDGREVRLGDFSVASKQTFRASQDDKLKRRLNGINPEQGLFVDPDLEVPALIQGQYILRMQALTFEPDADIEAKMVLYGQVHGWAGTDHYRRDLTVALLWGTPIALSFGLLASLGIAVSTMLIAAVGTWFGGWVDELIQRVVEVNYVIPFLPILIMIGTFYSKSIFLILGVTILLSIFGTGIKTYRAIFLQVKEAPYVEAARAYGTSSLRIILRYLIPRVVPLLIPALVAGIPFYVFLEASLAVLGLGDPVLPTWGKIIDDARANGALFQGYYYWILEPSVLLMFTGLAFALVGFALDRVFNPRLRGI